MAAPTVAPPLALHIQPACLEHKYIRHKDSSHIFERPERLRAVLLGFAAALARLEAVDAAEAKRRPRKSDGDELSSMLNSLSLNITTSLLPASLVSLVQPPPRPIEPGQVLLHHPALQLAHSPPIEAPYPYLPNGASGVVLPSSSYLKDLFKWASEAVETIRATGCEIPADKGLNAGDLYLGPGSIVAIEGAVQTVCQAVDGVCRSQSPHDARHPQTTTSSPTTDGPQTPQELSPSKAFCAIRPPGHHCGEDEPSGFCYVNNVVVGAMHAYLQHDIDRAIIIDFDLHHGNGTQALVMPLNAASYSEDLAVEAGKPPTDMCGRNERRRTWKGFYGSVHDIYSYPCEDGDLDLVKDASVSLAAHGQYIENIHLQPYADEEDFYRRIYPLYLALLDKARVFMRETGADPDRTMLFISAGFDACEHEHQGMQRHDRRVPVSFYSRYTKDIAAFADQHTGGKVVSVLEGGYGDRALTSAALGHAIGLMGRQGNPEWWSVDELVLLERAVKKRRKGKLCTLAADLAQNPHIARTHALLAHLEGTVAPVTPAPSNAPSAAATPQTNQRMTLRERRPKAVEEDSPRPATRRRKPASTAATPKTTTMEEKEERERETSPTPSGSPNSVPAYAQLSVPSVSKLETLGIDAANVYPSPTPSASSPEATKPTVLTEGLVLASDGMSLANAGSTEDTRRIMLRIPARTPPPPSQHSQSRDPATSETENASEAKPALAEFKSASSEPYMVEATTEARWPQGSLHANAHDAGTAKRSEGTLSFRPIAPEAVVLPPTPVRVPAANLTAAKSPHDAAPSSSSASPNPVQPLLFHHKDTPVPSLERVYPRRAHEVAPSFSPLEAAPKTTPGLYPTLLPSSQSAHTRGGNFGDAQGAQSHAYMDGSGFGTAPAGPTASPIGAQGVPPLPLHQPFHDPYAHAAPLPNQASSPFYSAFDSGGNGRHHLPNAVLEAAGTHGVQGPWTQVPPIRPAHGGSYRPASKHSTMAEGLDQQQQQQHHQQRTHH